MAIDRKYGHVTLEHGTIGEDEPVVVFRAKDILLPKVMAYYAFICMKAGSPVRHINIVYDSMKNVEAWQRMNEPKVPDSEASKKWLNH